MTKQLEAVLAYLKEHHAKWGCLPSTVELANHFRVGVQSMRNSLVKLANHGCLERVKVGRQRHRVGEVVVYRLKEAS